MLRCGGGGKWASARIAIIAREKCDGLIARRTEVRVVQKKASLSHAGKKG